MLHFLSNYDEFYIFTFYVNYDKILILNNRRTRDMKKSNKNLVVLRLIISILLAVSLSACSVRDSALEEPGESYDLVQIDRLDETLKKNEEKDVIFLVFYSYVNSNETIEYQERYSFCYRREDGGIIKDSITIEDDQEVVVYPLDEGEKPRLEIWRIEGFLGIKTEFRFFVPEESILELYGFSNSTEIEPDDES